jgi:tetratricopeptide (TPR) repeat protein
MGDIQQAKEYLEQSLVLCRKIEDVDGIATRLSNLGRTAYFQGDYARARALIEEGQTYYKKAGNLQAFNVFYFLLMYITPDPDTLQKAEKALAYSREIQDTNQKYILLSFSEILWSQGNFEQAEKYGQEVFIFTREEDWDQGFSSIQACLRLGRLALSQGDYLKARQYIKMAVMKTKKQISTDAMLESNVLDALAIWLTAEGKMEQAAQALGALDKMYRRLEPSFLPRKLSEHETALSTVRLALGEPAFTQAWKEGQAKTLGEAIEIVKQAERWEKE